jgi:diguanylate cyclase (GGDEF)-like protein
MFWNLHPFSLRANSGQKISQHDQEKLTIIFLHIRIDQRLSREIQIRYCYTFLRGEPFISDNVYYKLIMKKATILLVDNDPTNLSVLVDFLDETGFETQVAQSGKGALRQLAYAQPDLILLDIMMPGLDGFETCRRLKANEATKDIPVIFMTALSEPIDKVKGLEVGGVDYITKPFNMAELLARVKTHLELRRYREELKRYIQQLENANEALRESQKELEIAARTDPLTHLSNRRDIIEKIEYEQIRFERSQRPFTLIIGDIDNFKRFNDTYGHDCGDFILVSVAKIMQAMIRKQDRLARWGGEEFLFFLPETELEGGRIVAEKIRAEIASQVYPFKAHTLSVTMTYGVSVFNKDSMSIDDCIKKADQALYQGKAQGKNCVVLSEPE